MIIRIGPWTAEKLKMENCLMEGRIHRRWKGVVEVRGMRLVWWVMGAGLCYAEE
jgi:hypothetical protein